jgi:hypothetical protein
VPVAAGAELSAAKARAGVTASSVAARMVFLNFDMMSFLSTVIPCPDGFCSGGIRSVTGNSLSRSG